MREPMKAWGEHGNAAQFPLQLKPKAEPGILLL